MRFTIRRTQMPSSGLIRMYHTRQKMPFKVSGCFFPMHFAPIRWLKLESSFSY